MTTRIPLSFREWQCKKTETTKRVKGGDKRKKYMREKLRKQNMTEKLSPSMPVSDWIDDFIKSDAPQFQGKSKKERIDMALAAHRSAQKEATNPVAKFAHKFNKSVAHKDKKKEQKKGYVKHKGKSQ